MTILEYYDIMCRKTDFTFRGWLKMDRTKWKVLDRGMIKYIAMFTMLLNHISTIFMESGNFLSELFLDVGYFTAIIMCYFLVEGYQYTHSKKKYAYRLMAFALISEIPYCLAFTKNGILEFRGLNMIFTLLICFCIILTAEKVKNIVWKVLFISMLILTFFDFGLGTVSTNIHSSVYMGKWFKKESKSCFYHLYYLIWLV